MKQEQSNVIIEPLRKEVTDLDSEIQMHNFFAQRCIACLSKSYQRLKYYSTVRPWWSRSTFYRHGLEIPPLVSSVVVILKKICSFYLHICIRTTERCPEL